MDTTFPGEWLCGRCSHTKDKHTRTMFFTGATLDTACDDRNYSGSIHCPCWRFRPVDNLTQIEKMAKLKELI